MIPTGTEDLATLKAPVPILCLKTIVLRTKVTTIRTLDITRPT